MLHAWVGADETPEQPTEYLDEIVPEDPNYRAYTEATELLFMNAVLLGPGR